MNNLHVKTGDTAVVLSGKEKGKRGKILSVNPKKGMVPWLHFCQQSFHLLPLMRVCPKCDKPTRVAHKITENGTKLTVCKHCGETL